MDKSPLTCIAKSIVEHAKILDEYNITHEVPPASFNHETFTDLPIDVEKARNTIVDLAQDLKRLAQGPRDLLMESLNTFTDLANLRFIYHYNIPRHVPLHSDISYAELSAACGIKDVAMLSRMIRVAMMNRIFIETKEGQVRHSAASRILNLESGSMDTCGFLLEEMFPAAAKMMEAIDKYPGSDEPNETGFNVAFNTSRPFYLELEETPERSRRFGSAMRWLSYGGRFSNDHLIRGYDWARLDHEGATVVDIGGGHGAVSVAIANSTEKIRFIVQDLPVTISQGVKLLPQTLSSRVSFMPHDFFVQQPVRGADIYFFRYILHNWSDAYARKILKAVVPAMKDGSRIICCEFLPADVSETAWSQKQTYNMDMIQAIGWNSVERTCSDWKDLFSSVDGRLVFLGTRTPPGCSVSLIEAVLEVAADSTDSAGRGIPNAHGEFTSM